MSPEDSIQFSIKGIIGRFLLFFGLGMIFSIHLGVWAINTKIDGLIKLQIATEACKHDSTADTK